MRPSRLTFRLLATVLLAAALVWFLERRVPSTDDQRTKGQKAFKVNAGDVQAIEVEQGDTTLLATRKNGTWMLDKPAGMRADSGQIHRLLDRMEKIGYGTLLTMDDIRARNMTYNDFGLVDPLAKITLHTERSRKEILLGRNTPLGHEIYVMEAGGRNVMSVESDLLDILPKEAHAWRDRRVFPCSPKDFTRVELRRPSGFVELARDDSSGVWEIRQPITWQATPEGIARLLQLLGTLRVEKFISDENPAVGGFGFEEERHVIRAWMEGHPYPLRLTIGKPIEGENNLLYARVDGVMAVFAVSVGIRNLADYELDALRDRRLLYQDIRNLRQIQIAPEEGPIVRLDRSEDGREWFLQAPQKRPAGVLQIGQIVKIWKEASVTDFLNDAAELTHPHPLYTITFSGDGNVQEKFEVFSTPSKTGAVILRALNHNTWVSASPESLRHVSTRVLDYRDHKVLSLDPNSVLSIQQRTSGGKSVSLLRSSVENEWRAESGSPVRTEAVNTLLQAAQDLQARRLVEANPSDLARYGLQEPTATITFGLLGTDGIGRALLIGSPATGGETYGMIRGQDMVFILSNGDLAPFMASLVQDPIPAPEDAHP